MHRVVLCCYCGSVQAPPSKKAEPASKNATPSTREPSSERPASAQEEEPSGDDESLKPPAGAASVKKIQEKKKEVPKKQNERARNNGNVFQVEEEEEPVRKPPDELLTANDEKQQRLKDERTLKILKWNFTFPTEEHVVQLQEQLGRHAKASLMGMLFHKDFKQHLKAIELLNKTGETNPEALVKNSDLLLKWCTLRFYETNPAVLIKGIHKAIAACVSDRDNNVRSAAINGLVACYREEGDQMWRAVGKMGDKERAMVEERIKRSGAAPGSAAPRGGAGPVKVGGKIVVPPGGE
ncbi:hypothetical protein ANCDUO_10840 [Ancylostoma duodenale]|uniref:HEAT repeat protein n=1 Tax=Ancylostoma duodenale TaxID=51022 RepID=A0A0C2CQB6_9BILA|nr:hypothetical protein ANCDUO_10840 [Ancylostoma duodenale]